MVAQTTITGDADESRGERDNILVSIEVYFEQFMQEHSFEVVTLKQYIENDLLACYRDGFNSFPDEIMAQDVPFQDHSARIRLEVEYDLFDAERRSELLSLVDWVDRHTDGEIRAIRRMNTFYDK